MTSTEQSPETVIVCEDDDATRELLSSNLALDRFRVLPAEDASAALRHSKYDHPDLILLDIALPDSNGIEVLRTIRAADGATSRHDPTVPILLITGRGEQADRVRGLNEGADDYLVKPFSYPELLARMHSVLRRCRGQGGSLLRAGEVVVDRARHQATVNGRPCTLSRKEFDLLAMLATEPGRVFTKRELLEGVWGHSDVCGTRTLDAHASRLRRKLDPAGRYVINVWGVGYRLEDL